MTEFEKLVMAMRDAQKKYYKTKDINVLRQAKALESKVDAHIRNAQMSQMQMEF